MKSVFTPEYEGFLESLIAALRAAGLTQEELAKRLGKPQAFVSKYERRERRLGVVELGEKGSVCESRQLGSTVIRLARQSLGLPR